MEIKVDKFDEIWEKLRTEFKSKFLTMMSVTPYNIAVVSCPDYMKADELKLELPMRSYVAAKHTSRDLWQGLHQREDFALTKVIGRIWCCPEFVEDLERLNDKDDGLTVLAEQEGRKFFDVQGRAWAFTGSLTVQPRHSTVICFI